MSPSNVKGPEKLPLEDNINSARVMTWQSLIHWSNIFLYHRSIVIIGFLEGKSRTPKVVLPFHPSRVNNFLEFRIFPFDNTPPIPFTKTTKNNGPVAFVPSNISALVHAPTVPNNDSLTRIEVGSPDLCELIMRGGTINYTPNTPPLPWDTWENWPHQENSSGFGASKVRSEVSSGLFFVWSFFAFSRGRRNPFKAHFSSPDTVYREFTPSKPSQKNS